MAAFGGGVFASRLPIVLSTIVDSVERAHMQRSLVTLCEVHLMTLIVQQWSITLLLHHLLLHLILIITPHFYVGIALRFLRFLFISSYFISNYAIIAAAIISLITLFTYISF